MGVEQDDESADAEDAEGGDGGGEDEASEAAEAVDDERPNKIKLLLDLQAPEVADVDVREDELAHLAEGKVGGVGEVEPLPVVPLQVQWVGEGEEREEKAIVKREDAEGAARVEVAEEVGLVEGVVEDAGDEEAGEGEEEGDADPEGSSDVDEEAEEGGGVGVVGPEEVVGEDEEDGDAADAIKRGDMAEAAGVCLVHEGGWRGGVGRGHGIRIRWRMEL